MFSKNIVLPLFLGSILFTAVNTAMASPEEELAAHERSASRQGGIAFLGGAVLGGLIAGPPGVIITATLGVLGASSHQAEKGKALLSSHLQNTQAELYALQEQQQVLEEKYQLALQELDQSRFRTVSLPENPAVVACCSNSELVLHFKTGSARIEPHYQSDLRSIAALVRDVPDPILELTGYADRRGDSQANQQLSQQRIRAVSQALTNYGVSNNIIRSSAFGDSRPLASDESLEGNFFDRRVIVTVRSRSNELVSFQE